MRFVPHRILRASFVLTISAFGKDDNKSKICFRLRKFPQANSPIIQGCIMTWPANNIATSSASLFTEVVDPNRCVYQNHSLSSLRREMDSNSG